MQKESAEKKAPEADAVTHVRWKDVIWNIDKVKKALENDHTASISSEQRIPNFFWIISQEITWIYKDTCEILWKHKHLWTKWRHLHS